MSRHLFTQREFIAEAPILRITEQEDEELLRLWRALRGIAPVSPTVADESVYSASPARRSRFIVQLAENRIKPQGPRPMAFKPYSGHLGSKSPANFVTSAINGFARTARGFVSAAKKAPRTVAFALAAAQTTVPQIAKNAVAYVRANGRTLAKEAGISMAVGAGARIVAGLALSGVGGLAGTIVIGAVSGAAVGLVRELRTKKKGERELLKATFSGAARSAVRPVSLIASSFSNTAIEAFKFFRAKPVDPEERKKAIKRIAFSAALGTIGALTSHFIGESDFLKKSFTVSASQASTTATFFKVPPMPEATSDPMLAPEQDTPFAPPADDVAPSVPLNQPTVHAAAYIAPIMPPADDVAPSVPLNPQAYAGTPNYLPPPDGLDEADRIGIAQAKQRLEELEAQREQTAAEPIEQVRQVEPPAEAPPEVKHEPIPVPRAIAPFILEENFRSLPPDLQKATAHFAGMSPQNQMHYAKEISFALMEMNTEGAREDAYNFINKGLEIAEANHLVETPVGRQLASDMAFMFATGKGIGRENINLNKAWFYARMAGEDNPYTKKLERFLTSKNPEVIERVNAVFQKGRAVALRLG